MSLTTLQKPNLGRLSPSTVWQYVGIAGFTILIWDHLDTFPTEVEYIWKPRKKGPIVYLFLLNRYLTPLGFIVNLFGMRPASYFSPVWTPERYENFT
ncbi:hypothetical protein B0H13DRAFT_2330858 [Mycena leptocephala]|nr:hypothetical protein B0H13DRAFT_2330858 [Mycena leptocephala]